MYMHKLVGGHRALPSAFQYILGMLALHDWKLRHTSVAESASKVMQNELGKVVEYI
jgi:hypothetical protein